MQTYSISNQSLNQIVLTETECYLSVYDEKKEEEQFLPDYTASIMAYSIEQNGILLWEYEQSDTIINAMKFMQERNHDFLLFLAYGYLGILDRKTGKLVEECNYANTITDFHIYEDTDLIGLMMRDGEYHIISVAAMTDYVREGKFEVVSNNLKQGFGGNKYFAYFAYQDTKIVIYQAVGGKELETICSTKGYIDHILVSDMGFSGTSAVGDNYSSIMLLDTSTGKITCKMEQKEELKNLGVYAVSENQKLYAIASKKDKALKLYNVGETESIRDIPVNAACISYMNFSNEGQKLYLTYLDNRVEVYDVTTLHKTAEYTDFQKEVKTVSYVKQSGYTFLNSIDKTYVLNEKGELIASVDGWKSALPNKGQYILFANFELVSVPQYDLKSLQEEAKIQLDKLNN